jgi:hypothetical protein
MRLRVGVEARDLALEPRGLLRGDGELVRLKRRRAVCRSPTPRSVRRRAMRGDDAMRAKRESALRSQPVSGIGR